MKLSIEVAWNDKNWNLYNIILQGAFSQDVYLIIENTLLDQVLYYSYWELGQVA